MPALDMTGRRATSSGKVVTWDEAVASELQLGPDYEDLAMDAEPPVLPTRTGTTPLPCRA
jgi:hypothetical protein